MIIDRDLTQRLRKSAVEFPAVTLTGPRQSGKSTLCREIFPRHSYVSLEAPDVRAFAVEDPRVFRAQFPKRAVSGEVQRAPDLPSCLQGIIDDDPKPGRWILTGSQNLSLLESVSQSLAGRSSSMEGSKGSAGRTQSFYPGRESISILGRASLRATRDLRRGSSG